MRLYQPLLWHWSRKNGIQPQDYEDVCQDVFKVVTVRICSFELGDHRGSFRAWLRAITNNVCQERFRQNGIEGRATGGTDAGARLQELPDQVRVEDDPTELVNDLYRRTISLVRNEFSDRDWRVFERLTFDNISPHEVAKELGLTPVNVRAIKSRIYRRLREELGEALDGI